MHRYRVSCCHILCFLTLCVWLANSSCNSPAQSRTSAQAPATPVLVTEVKSGDVRIYTDYPAQTYARNTVQVRGRVDGYIDQWLFRPGQEVHSGDVLYVLDLRPYQAAVEQAKGNLSQSEADLEFARKQVALLQAEANLAVSQANLVKAKQDYERLAPLVKDDAAAQQELDAAVAALRAGEANVKASQANVDQTRLSTQTQIASTEGKVEAQRAALRTATLNLDYATIRAPISGLIGDTLVPVGGLVTANSQQPLTTIVPLDPIWVRFNVTESTYLSFRRNQTPLHSDLTLILADNSVFPGKGRIQNTLNQVDPKTGTLEIQANFPNPQHTLLPGQFGKVRLESELRHNALLVPQRAIQQLQSIQTVYVVNAANQVDLREITTGERVGDNWLVEKGLRPGDRVIVEGQLKVRPGMTVAPMPYHAPPAGAAESSGS
ncbi:MAG TPA: efflux RND transporter periplasmic adaptor subunit [Bryobacteraceae bacterium]|nr:efflux RND transporter periplasmic adaptor subunit [Bryobacteraceae bacterium]